MSAGRAELTNVRPPEDPDTGILSGRCDECNANLVFWIEAGAAQPCNYEEASIVLRCSCGAQSQYTVTP